MANGRWTLERWLLILTMLMSAGAFIFGVGVQWAKTTAVEARVAALAVTQTDYVRADVYAADQHRLADAIERLIVAVDALTRR